MTGLVVFVTIHDHAQVGRVLLEKLNQVTHDHLILHSF